jgi:hypothetical protein
MQAKKRTKYRRRRRNLRLGCPPERGLKEGRGGGEKGGREGGGGRDWGTREESSHATGQAGQTLASLVSF